MTLNLTEEQNTKILDKNDVRDIVLSELNNFRGNVKSFWGGVGNLAGNLFGLFAKQGFGSYYQSPHVMHTTQLKAAGNDFGRIFVEAENDDGVDTPSWSFDLPTFTQKMLIKSTGPGVVYHTETAAFTEGAILTGATSGAQATITAVFPEGTDGTLYLADFKKDEFGVIIPFNDTEAVTDSLGGAATLTRATANYTNPIVRIYGVGGENADDPGSIYSFWGLTDFFAPIGLFNQPSSANTTKRDVELIPAFESNGVMYIRNTAGTRALRMYINGAWTTIGASAAMKVTSATRSLAAAAGDVTYAHGLGTTPTKVQINAVESGNFSNGAWDGTDNMCAYGGGGVAVSTGQIIFIDQGGGNIHFGAITDADATNITITWDKSGAPAGTAEFIISSWA